MQLSSVNDEYVVERCLCAAYGTLLRTRDADAERAVAAAVCAAVFADPLSFQNALIRDHARCLVESAAQDGVLPAGIDLATVRPPYESEWPLTIPSEEDVERYEEARQDYPRLSTSCLHDNFFTYLLSRLEPYEHAISRPEMGRWVLHHVVEPMGYGGKVLAGYDGCMIHRYGGGRGRPGWPERIGKKYQWIALSRLAATRAGHAAGSSGFRVGCGPRGPPWRAPRRFLASHRRGWATSTIVPFLPTAPPFCELGLRSRLALFR